MEYNDNVDKLISVENIETLSKDGQAGFVHGSYFAMRVFYSWLHAGIDMGMIPTMAEKYATVFTMKMFNMFTSFPVGAATFHEIAEIIRSAEVHTEEKKEDVSDDDFNNFMNSLGVE